MIINTNLTMFRCKLRQIDAKTTMEDLKQQEHKLHTTLDFWCLSPDEVFKLVKFELDKAMQKGESYLGFTDEVELLIDKEGDKNPPRGHDYLKLWFKTYFMINFSANFIIADAATHNILQNVLTYEHRAELLRMIRGSKRDLVSG